MFALLLEATSWSIGSGFSTLQWDQVWFSGSGSGMTPGLKSLLEVAALGSESLGVLPSRWWHPGT